MTEYKVRHRHRLRQKEIETLKQEIEKRLGTSIFSVADAVEVAEVYGIASKVYILERQIVAVDIDGEAFLSLRGLLKYGASREFVTVDMGAVPFVSKGADVMGPGITGGDASIMEGELVWVRDERYGRPLAIGRSMVKGEMLGSRRQGKFIETLYHIGDKLWQAGEGISSEE